MKKLLFILLILTGCVSQQFVDKTQYNEFANGSTSVMYSEAIDFVMLFENNGFNIETVSDNMLETTSKFIDQQTEIKFKVYIGSDKVRIVAFWKPSQEIVMVSSSIGMYGNANEWTKATKGNGGRDDLAFAYLISICNNYDKNYTVN